MNRGSLALALCLAFSTVGLFAESSSAQPAAPEPPPPSVPAPASAPATTPAPASQPEHAPRLPAMPFVPAVEPPPALPAAGPMVHEAERSEPPGSLVDEDLDLNQVLVRRGEFSLRLGALLQVQGAYYVGDEAAIANFDPADTEGFRIRRARFGLAGTLLRDVIYYLAVDLKDTVLAALGGDRGSEILDAKIEWTRFSFLMLSAGLMKVPFSAFELQSSSHLTMIERPLTVRWLSPEYRVGLAALGQLRGLRYAAGLYNGSAGMTSGNRQGGLAGVGRLQYGLLSELRRWVPEDLDVSIGGAYMFDDGPAVRFHRVSGSLEARYWRIGLLGELLWQLSQPQDRPAGDPQQGDVHQWGVAGELSGFVFRDLVQLAARYEYFRANESLQTFGEQQLITAGVNVYLRRDNLKLQINYIRRDELEGPEVANDTGFAQLQAMF